jgi:hypothetical protein
MKTYFTFLTIIFNLFLSQIIYPQCGQPQQPEFYFYIKDNPGAYYTIFAQKIGTSPIYDYNFQSTSLYDQQWERIDDYGNVVYFWAAPNQYTQGRGFDWGTRSDAGAGCRGILGYGLYRIDIMRVYQPGYEPSYTFSFYFDLRQTSWTGSPDLIFWFDYNDGSGLLNVNKSGGQQRTVAQYELVELWTELGIPLNRNEIVKNSLLKNDFNGNLNYNVPIVLEEAENGFPLEQYNPGHTFPAGSSANFWKESYNRFIVTGEVVNFSGNNFKARHWNDLEDFGNVGRVKIIGNQQTAFFKPVIPFTVNNNLEGVSSNNAYEITWHNPDPEIITTWQYGTDYNAFDYSYNSDFYSVEALTPMQSLGTAWHFHKWNDGSTNNIKSNLQITAPTTFTAYYKGIQRSDDQNAYANNSQRKFVRSDDGILHNVYSSMGRVWYETSSNNGVTWLLANNGQPLDNGEGKFPSIDYSIYYGSYETYYQVFIVFQEKYGSSSKIKVKYFQSIGGGIPYYPVYQADVGSVQGSYYSTNTTPVIGVHSNYFTVVWKRTGDLYARAGHINIPGGIVWDSGNALTGTYSTSVNPTISFSKTFYSHQKLAWEDQADGWKVIKYATLSGSQISGSITTPSNGSGFSDNYSPSIVQFMNASRLCWVGSRWVSDPINEEDGFPQTKVLFKAPESTPSRFWQFGNYVSGPSINRKTGDDTYYAFAWYESSGQSKFADNTLSTIRTITGVNGQNLQISNGPNKENMFCMSFNHNVTVPYIFQMSDDLGSFYNMEKITYFSFNSGREGIVFVDSLAGDSTSAEFYFAIGDISVDEQQINFKEIEDSIQISTLSVLNDYLITDPFDITDNSSFTYSVQYGINDSVSAVNALTGNNSVNFVVKLIDENTGEILSEFDNITYNSENVYQYNNITYQVNTQGLGNRTVRLKLIIDNNFSSDYSMSKIYSDESVLSKINFKEININGNGVISTYDLFQNYPNPFNPTTTIKYQIPKSGNVTLKVYDILGNEVTKLVDEYMETGRYEIGFDASILASGVYIYRLTVNDFVNVKKMVLLR